MSSAATGFRQQVTPSASGLAAATVTLCAWLAARGVPASALGHVELVLEEVVMNVIMHGAPTDGASPSIDLSAQVLADGCRLAVTDNGPPFDPVSTPPRRDGASLDQDNPGGLGLLLLRRFSRDLAYERLAAGNRLVLTVPFRPA